MKLNNLELKTTIAEGGVLDKERLNELYTEAENKHLNLQNIIVDNNILTEEQIGQLIASRYDVPFTTLKRKIIDESILHTIPKVVAEKQKTVAFDEDEHSIKIGTPEPENIKFFHVLQKKTGKDVLPFYITEDDFKAALSRYKRGLYDEFEKLVSRSVDQAKLQTSSDTPIIDIVNLLLSYAYDNAASDIHIEPKEQEIDVRFRIDGILHSVIKIPKQIEDRIVSRIKVLAKLRTDEHNRAQDGRFLYKSADEKIDVRVSVLPVAWGEKVVLRLLSSKNKYFTLRELGYSEEDLKKVMKAIDKSYGMILATGPTGSGKTTTLYAILRILNKKEVNISTIEDPIEYSMQGINQVQVNPKTNLTFADGLKSLLRQDPDILMVGEIRDEETARIATNSALTGHLVLSTLHTNDASTALPRLLDMGIKPYLIASTIEIVIAQRLVRKICKQCVQSRKLTEEEIQLYGKVLLKSSGKKDLDKLLVYEGKGCNNCSKTGYMGRIGIFEILVVDDDISALINKGADRDLIEMKAKEKGMTTMFEDGIKKVLQGITTIEEVLRVSEF